MSKKQYSSSNSAKAGNYGYSSESGASIKNKKSSNGKSNTIVGIVLAIIQLALSIAFVALTLSKKFVFVTPPILIGVIAILLVLLGIALFTQHSKSKGIKTTGKVISVITSIILIVLIYMVYPIKPMSGNQISDDKPFVVYVSASDTFGTLDNDTLSRSDTNILAIVNPKTHVVLMVSTPRDYYVEIKAKDVAPNSFDKLTHLGLYGNGKAFDSQGNRIGVTGWTWGADAKWGKGNKVLMDTLKDLYDVQIDNKDYHYVKLNFTGFAKLIDDIGGITVNVDQGFKTKTYADYGDVDNGDRKTYVFTEGDMKMDGKTALTYARERHAFGSGDMQRNKNQVKVIEALSDQLLSSNILLHYTSVVNDIQNSFTTDMDISSLVALQQAVSDDDDFNGWKIMSFSATGSTAGGYQLCTFTGSNLSVVQPDETSIANAKELIQMTIDGKNAKQIKKRLKNIENQ